MSGFLLVYVTSWRLSLHTLLYYCACVVCVCACVCVCVCLYVCVCVCIEVFTQSFVCTIRTCVYAHLHV